MGSGKNSAEENADAADSHICNSEEGVSATHDCARTDEDGLRALVLLRGEEVVDNNLILALGHSVVFILLVQLAECGQTGRAHPNLKGLPFLEIGRRSLRRVIVGVAFSPVGRWQDVGWFILGLAVKLAVAGPGNALL